MTRKKKPRQASKSQLRGPELTDDELEGAVGGAGVAVGGTTLYPTPPAPAGQSLQGTASGGGDWRAVAAANGIESPRHLKPGQQLILEMIELQPGCKIA